MSTKRSPFRWFALGCGGLLGLIVIVLAFLCIQMAATPRNIVAPRAKAPVPNAYDYYISAAKVMKDPSAVGWLQSGECPPPPGKTSGAKCTLADQEACIKANGPALKLLRQGLNYRCLTPDSRSVAGAVLFPQQSKVRQIARLCSLDAKVKAGRGDWSGAVNSQIDDIQMGSSALNGANMMQSLVGTNAQAIGRRDIWPEVDHLSAKEAQLAEKRMETICSRQVSIADVITEEKWTGMTQLDDLQGSSSPSIPGTAPVPSHPRWPKFVVRKAQYEYGKRFDAAIAEARKPYPLRKIPTTPGKTLNPVTMVSWELADILIPVTCNCGFSMAKDEAENRLLMIELALRAYRLDHGGYPASLNELTPKYLSKLPIDPFAVKGTFQYKKIGSKFMLYSIGPDGKDDGGKPACDTARTGTARYYVFKESKGDIMAGMNY